MHETNRYPRPFGKYLLLRQLAIGGMAEVYLARQSGPAGFEKECVIKRILPSLAVDQQFVNMFLDEARIAARLSHPNIVQIFDLGTIDTADSSSGGDYFLAMEHVHGVDLQQIEEAEHARGGRIPLAVAVRIASNVAEGLEHAHRATDGRGHPLGLVHRDVTPSNVIVSFDGVAKILDFGIAKAVAQKHSGRGRTEIGVIKGKIPYMSPEQVQGEVLDSRSDIFSLGTMLYELTTGQKPFDGEGPADLSMKILNLEPPPAAKLVPDYPAELSYIIQRAMAKRPADRWPSARELHEALDDFLVQSGIRCSSHDVSSYLDGLFPGVREAARAEASQQLPVEVTDPTVPMHLGSRGSDPGRRRDEQALSMGEVPLASANELAEVRRMGGGGRGSGSTVVVVLLVVAVAAIFYVATSRGGGDKSSAATTTPAPGATTPPKPTEKPAATAKPETPKPRPSELPAPSVHDTTPIATPAATTKPADTTPAETPAKKAEHVVKPKPPKPQHHDKPVALPHLPSPPPPDDAP